MRCIPLSRRGVGFLCRVFAGVIAGAITLGIAPVAPASIITFAQFQETATGSDANQFAYLNNGPAADADLVTDPSGVPGAAIPVTFNYLSLTSTLPADLQGQQNATVTLTSSTTSAAATGFGGSIGDEPITGDGGLTDVLSITRDTPAAEGAGSRTNLLTMTFTGQLFGAVGGLTPQLGGDSPTFTVTYTSDFLSFTGSTQRDYSMAFTSWTTTAADANNGLGLEIAADNYFESATAAGSATFDSSAVSTVTIVPEAATSSSMIWALFPLLACRRHVTENSR
jgi:hypothetical protein